MDLALLDITTDDRRCPRPGRNAEHCHRFQLTAYEAAYLELAQRRTLPLAAIYPPTARRNS
jgi:hypothetical protein